MLDKKQNFNNQNSMLKKINFLNGHRFIALLTLLLTTAVGAFAQKVSIDDVSIAPGETATVSISLENDAACGGSFAGNIYLPAGFTVTNYGGGAQGIYVKKTSRVPSSFTVGSSTHNENTALAANQVRFSLLGLGKKVAAGKGAILQFEITAPWDFYGTDAQIILKDATITDANGKAVKADCKANVYNSDLKVEVSADEVTVTPSQQTTISIIMDNVPNVAAFEGKITLPEGLSFVENEEGDYCTPSERLSLHSLSSNGTEKSAKFMAFAMPPANISGNNGEIFTITVKGDAKLAKESVITLTELVANSLSGAKFLVEDAQIKVTNPDVDAKEEANAALTALKNSFAAAQEALKAYDEDIQEGLAADVKAAEDAIAALDGTLASAVENGTVAADLATFKGSIADAQKQVAALTTSADAAKAEKERAAAQAAEDAKYQENLATVAAQREALSKADADAKAVKLDKAAEVEAAKTAIQDFAAKVEANHAALKSVEAAADVDKAAAAIQAQVKAIQDAADAVKTANEAQFAKDSEAIAAAQKALDDAKAVIAGYDQSVQDAAAEAIAAAQKAIDDAKAAAEASHTAGTSVADTETNAALVAAATSAIEKAAADAKAAQEAWEEAQKPQYDKADIADGDYYIKNVESGLFLTGNNSWGTQASAGKAGAPFTVAALENGGYSLLHTLVTANNKYLGANLFVDSTTPEGGFEFYQVEGGIAIALGNKFLTQSATIGANNEPIIEAVDEVTEAAKWVFLTKEEAVATLAAAKKSAPVDATFLLSNPGFNRNTSTAAWVVEAGNKNLAGGANENMCAESWRSAFTISQSVEVPNGIYTVTAQAALTDYAELYDGADYPVVFANDVTAPFNSMDEADRATNMSTLSNSFKEGKYGVGPLEVVVTDGVLTIGVKGTREDTWAIWDNFQLTYNGKALPKTIEIADGDYYIKNEESGLFLTGNNSWGTQASAGKAGVPFTVAALENGGYSLLHTLVTANNKYLGANLYVDSTTPEGGFKFYDGGDGAVVIGFGEQFLAQSATMGANNEPIIEAVDDVDAATKWRLLTKEEAVATLADATAATPVDATFLLKNPGFNRNTSTEAWVVEASNKNLAGGANENMCAESWRSTFTVTQSVEVPNGLYKVTAQAALTDYAELYDGADYPVVFANDVTAPFNNMDEADRATNMGTLSNSFKEGKYGVSLEVEVTDGVLNVGVKGTREDTWAIWDNFQMVYCGVVEEKPELVYEDLTADMFKSWTAADASGEETGAAGCAYVIGESTGMPYGDGNVYYLNYADLSEYAAIELVATEGEPRLLFNRVEDNGTVNVELPRDAATYETVVDNGDGSKTYTIDIAKIVETYGFAHLHAIKGANWANTTVTSIKVGKVGVPEIAKYEWSYDFEADKEGVAIVGAGSIVEDPNSSFGKVYQNVTGDSPRKNWLTLPEDVLAHSAESKELSIAFWVSAGANGYGAYTYAPFFTAYATNTNGSANGAPMLALQSRGNVQVNNNGWCDFTAANHVDGKVNIYNQNAWEASDAAFNFVKNWLDDGDWHYYTVTFTETNVKQYLDGEITNEWNIDGATDGQVVSGLFSNGADLKYICLGGNQAWDWWDGDSPFFFDDVLITNYVLSPEAIAATVAEKTTSYIDVDGAKVPVIAEVEVDAEDEAGTAYSGKTATFDADAILAAFGEGTTMSDVKVYWANPDGTTVEAVYGGGTIDGWRNAEGYAAQWADCTDGLCVKIQDPASGQIDYIGAHDANFASGESYSAPYAFVKDGKAVILNITVEFAVPVGIADIDTAAPAKANGKYFENGKVVILKNGVKYNTAGQAIK